MSNLVERERPIELHGPEGEMARVVLLWRRDDHPVPAGFCITVTISNGYTKTLHEQSTYQNYLEARDRAMTMAKNTMNKMSGRP